MSDDLIARVKMYAEWRRTTAMPLADDLDALVARAEAAVEVCERNYPPGCIPHSQMEEIRAILAGERDDA